LTLVQSEAGTKSSAVPSRHAEAGTRNYGLQTDVQKQGKAITALLLRVDPQSGNRFSLLNLLCFACHHPNWVSVAPFSLNFFAIAQSVSPSLDPNWLAIGRANNQIPPWMILFNQSRSHLYLVTENAR
jgi:hypothetical protein